MTMNTRLPDGSIIHDRSGPKDMNDTNSLSINLQDTTVGELVSSMPHLRLHPDCPVDKVLSGMSSTGRQIAGIIEEDGTFLGFITRSTLIGKLVMDQGLDQSGNHLKAAGLKNLAAADVMIRNPAFLPSELGLSDALAIMTEYGHPIMPVLGDRGRLVGFAEMRHLNQAQRILNSEIVHQHDHGLNALIAAKAIRTEH